jgi:hypothetical protein
MAPEVGLEPTTNRLTADRSTTELLRNVAGTMSKSQALGGGNSFAGASASVPTRFQSQMPLRAFVGARW